MKVAGGIARTRGGEVRGPGEDYLLFSSADSMEVACTRGRTSIMPLPGINGAAGPLSKVDLFPRRYVAALFPAVLFSQVEFFPARGPVPCMQTGALQYFRVTGVAGQLPQIIYYILN